MKLRRFKILKENILGDEAILDDPGEIRHLSKVLRLKPGHPVVLFDGEGREYAAEIGVVESGKVSFRILQDPRQAASESSLKIILGIGLLKSTKLDWVIQKTTELGVDEILPFYSLRVVSRPADLAAQNRRTRWEKIGAAAAKQCARAKVPKIHSPCSFPEALAAYPEAKKIFLWEKEPDSTLTDALRVPAPEIFALVGPEGGFSAEEANQARETGFSPVRLGPRVLRAETAGLVVVALLQYLCGDLR
jgi:16S rRNA (uracil1498-N3)-methyltransferase